MTETKEITEARDHLEHIENKIKNTRDMVFYGAQLMGAQYALNQLLDEDIAYGFGG